jgi:hypothetical protein
MTMMISGLLASSAGGLILLVLVFIAVFWILPVYLAAQITSNRGRGTVAGVLLGLFLGWIGVLIALMLGRARTAAG